MGTTARQEPANPSLEEPAPAPAALVAFVRLLARHAAQDAFATAHRAMASEIDDPEPEHSREAEA